MAVIADRLALAHQRSVALYLQRQQIETERQQLTQQAHAIEMELLKLDGEIRVLDTLTNEGRRGE